jgi:hypothetical protein
MEFTRYNENEWTNTSAVAAINSYMEKNHLKSLDVKRLQNFYKGHPGIKDFIKADSNVSEFVGEHGAGLLMMKNLDGNYFICTSNHRSAAAASRKVSSYHKQAHHDKDIKIQTLTLRLNLLEKKQNKLANSSDRPDVNQNARKRIASLEQQVAILQESVLALLKQVNDMTEKEESSSLATRDVDARAAFKADTAAPAMLALEDTSAAAHE